MSEKLEAVATSEAPAALGDYSQGVKANGFVFVSGQLGIDPATGELAGESAGEQAAQALKNIKQILDTAGTGIEHVVRATIYMKNVEDFKEVDARYADVFIGSVKPARVAFGNNMIPKGALVELDAIAAVALGGNSLGGGRFSLLGSVIGAYTIQALTTTLYAMSVPADQIPVYKAIVVILIVAVQSEELKKFRKRLASRHSSKNVEGRVA